MFRRLLSLCAICAGLFACNAEENPDVEEPAGAYDAAFDSFWAMCIEGEDGAEPVLGDDDPGVFQIIDLWHGDVVGADSAPFVVTVGRLHPLPLEAAFLKVRAYPIGADGIELIPMQPADHDIDDSPIPPVSRSEPLAYAFSDIERDIYGIEIDMGEQFFDALGNVDHGVLPGCEAALLRGELIVHDSGTYQVQVDLLFEDGDGNTLRMGDVVEVVAE